MTFELCSTMEKINLPQFWWKNHQSILSSLAEVDFIYYGKIWNGQKYSFANVKCFFHIIWKCLLFIFDKSSERIIIRGSSNVKSFHNKCCVLHLHMGIFFHFKFYHDRRNDFSLSWFFSLSQFSFLKTFIFSVQCSESTDLWPVPHSTGKINLPAEFEGKIVRLKLFVVQWCFIMKLQNKVTRGNRFKLHIWAL